MKISVCVPTVRPSALDLVRDSMKKQTFQDFELLICAPFVQFTRAAENINWLEDPGKNKGDYYSLMKAWNVLFRKAKGELIVTVCDNEYIKSDALERLWDRYEEDPKSCVSGIGDHFVDVVNGHGTKLVWADVRPEQMSVPFGRSTVINFDQALCSFPAQAIKDVGGMEEEFDKVASNGEQEMVARIVRKGYSIWIDQDIQYIARHHERLNEQWGEMFEKGREMLRFYLKKLDRGERDKLEYI